MLARENENFRTPGENWTHDPPVEYYMFIARFNHWTGGSRVWFLPRAWKFPLSRASMVSPPSKLKMFTGNLCVLLVTPQNVILTQNVIRIAAKCNTNAKCNNIDAKCNKIFNAECNNLSTEIVITFLAHNVITQNVIISE